MPKPTPEQKQLMRDKATLQAEVYKYRTSTGAEKAAATNKIAKTILRGTGLSATKDTPELLARLASELLADKPAVAASDMDSAIKYAAAKLKLKDAEIASIPKTVVSRLDRLVL